MTNNLEISPDIFENDEQDNENNLSDLSLASSPRELNQQEYQEEEIKNDDLPSELHDQIDEVLRIDENEEEESDLIKFIKKARQQDFNCLDLSKKNITQFPSILLEFPSLQVNKISFNKISFLFFFFLVLILRR